MTDSDSPLELPEAVETVFAPARRRPRRWLEPGLRWMMRLLLAAAFLYAGALKALDPIRFAEDIRNFQLLPDPYPAALALGLPWLEILAALGVLTGVLYRGSLVILSGMLVVFIAALSAAWAQGLDISCGCFGDASGESTNYPWSIFRNLVLLGLCGVLMIYRLRQDQRP